MSAAPRDLPPWSCQRCRYVEVSQTRVLDSRVARWTCTAGLHMQAHCTARVPTPGNQPKEPPPWSAL